MARKMSNRGRIDRMREEAAATEVEKKKKREEAALAASLASVTPRSIGRKKAAPKGRMKIVWGVKNSEGEIVATYPYPHKAAAEAAAQELRDSGQRGSIVCPHKVPIVD
ncbi:MAG: hypothetical protein ACYTGZ_03000 [Planctomycetota bacterium]|jgi:hypothetical protein